MTQSPLAGSSTSWSGSVLSNPDLQRLLTPKLSRYCPHLPTEQQTLALVAHNFLPVDEPSEVFYGGAAGGGKSDWLLMGGLEYVDVPDYAAIIFRRTFTDLALPGAVMSRSKQWLAGTDAVWNEQQKQWRFPSGATLQFAYMDHPGDELRYQSAEFQYVGFDELTQFPEAQYTYLFSRLRRPEDGLLSRVPLRMRAGSNPGGVGHGWVKRRFPVDGLPRGRRVFIPAKIADNPHLDATAYRASLARLGETLQRQLEDGNWDVAEGLAFNAFNATHLIDDLDIPAAWDRFESMDFGVANPTCVLAWCVDNDGNAVIFDSYYQADTLVSDHAKAIEAKRKLWGTSVSYADPSMWARTGRTNRWGEPATDVTEFAEHGIDGLVQANNRRRPGRSRLLELLKCDPAHRFPNWHRRVGEPGSPRLFVVSARCPELVEQLQTAPLLSQDSAREGAGEIIDPDWETNFGHATAAARYGAMAKPGPSTAQPVLPDWNDEAARRAFLQAQALERSEQRWEREHAGDDEMVPV